MALPRLEDAVIQRIRELAQMRLTDSEITRQLELEFEAAPSRRAVGKYAKEVRSGDSSGPWVASDDPPEVAARILPVLRETIERTNGRITTLTSEEARLINWIRVVAPSFPADRTAPQGFALFVLARTYASRRERGEPTDDLDQFVALAHWDHADSEALLADWEQQVRGARTMRPDLRLVSILLINELKTARILSDDRPPDADVEERSD